MSSSSSTEEQQVESSKSTESDVDVAGNLQAVRERMLKAMEASGRLNDQVRLVAVSKTKPVQLLVDAYKAGQRHFGENYAQELLSKSTELVPTHPEIQFHFIGPLQSNKAASLVKTVGLDHLACIETVSTIKLARKLNRAVEDVLVQEQQGEAKEVENKQKKKLGIYLQVNTSGEDSKSGVTPDDLVELASEIRAECPHLHVRGLMTIGAPGDASCFDTLAGCRTTLVEALQDENMKAEDLELSMGMSGDFETAIAKGATNVRVGSTIFGARDYSNLKK